MIAFAETELEGVLVLTPQTIVDQRGRFTKPFHAPSFAARGLVTDYAEHYYSVTKRGAVRGMHFQRPPAAHAKIVVCLAGAVLDVVLDLRSSSPTFGKAASLELEGAMPKAVYIPVGFAHGFAALRDDTLMSYMVSTPYRADLDQGVLWNSVDAAWPFQDATVSDRDQAFPAFSNFQSPF